MKRHISEIDHERLTAEIANLAGLPLPACIWKASRSHSDPPTSLAISNRFCRVYSVMIFTRVLETNSTPGGSPSSTRKRSAA